MGITLDDISNDALLAALEANMIAFWKPYGRAPGGELYDSLELMRFISGSPIPLFNGMMGARLPANRADEVIAESRRACIQHKVSALWWVGPGAQPKDLGVRLTAHGFTDAGSVPGMALDLRTLQAAGWFTDELEVRPVTTASQIESWSEIAWVGSGFPAGEAGLSAKIERQIGIDPVGLRRRYLGFWNGRPVGTSVLVLDAGLAGIFAVSTLPQARGHGLGTALTVQPLLDAREAGFQVAALQASEMGYPIYRKLGFQVVCQFNLFLWERP